MSFLIDTRVHIGLNYNLQYFVILFISQHVDGVGEGRHGRLGEGLPQRLDLHRLPQRKPGRSLRDVQIHLRTQRYDFATHEIEHEVSNNFSKVL